MRKLIIMKYFLINNFMIIFCKYHIKINIQKNSDFKIIS